MNVNNYFIFIEDIKGHDEIVSSFKDSANMAREISGMALEETLMIKYITYEYIKSM